MLSTTSEYALRALARLARSGDEPVLARDLAEQAEVPPPYMAKILSALSKVGLLVGARGARGGYRLARPAQVVPLLEVVELFDGVQARPKCLFGGDRACSDDDPCPAHDAWKQVRDTYVDFLERTSLADLAERDPGEGDRPGVGVGRPAGL